MTTDSFRAERKPNGDVFITGRRWGDETVIVIPKEHCMELARLLLEPVSFPGPEPCYKTDFSRCAGEPE